MPVATWRVLGSLAVSVACVGSAAAQGPVAIVEQVESRTAGVEMMDYLDAGRVVTLAPNDKLVVGYLKSCWQETIAAGTVTIGTEQSEVRNGKIERSKVACDGAHASLSAEQLKKSGAMAFRAKPKKGALPPVQATLYGLSPVIEAKTAGKLVIERLDQAGDKIELDVGGPSMLRGAFFDLAKANTELAAGGVYRASLGDKEVVFKIDALAKAGAGPLVGRLLRLAPAG